MPDTVCSLLSIGQELLLGLTVDTNAAWLCREVSALGWRVAGVRLVPDEQEAIVAGLRAAAGEAALVLVTGGLGPTPDDLTRAAFAELLQQPLEERAELVEMIAARFKAIGRPMRPVNRVQALIPRTAEGILNLHGTAPGIAARFGEARLFAMPGVPREMKPMFAESIKPRIAPGGNALRMRRYHLFGLGESTVGEWIRDQDAPGVELGTTVEDGVITVRFLSRRNDADECFDRLGVSLRQHHGDMVFGRDGQRLEEVALALLRARGETLALAESCTGGLLAERLVAVPGASDVVLEGVVCYANAAKLRLGVDETVLQRHGAVSAEVAAALADSVRRRSGATCGIGITGIAGPGGGSAEKPVGLVWLALAAPDDMICLRRQFANDRDGNRRRAVHTALDLLCRRAAGRPLPPACFRQPVKEQP